MHLEHVVIPPDFPAELAGYTSKVQQLNSNKNNTATTPIVLNSFLKIDIYILMPLHCNDLLPNCPSLLHLQVIWREHTIHQVASYLGGFPR